MPRSSIELELGGAFLDVNIGRPRAGFPENSSIWRALLDTGANMTAISPAVVAAVNPQLIGRQPVKRPNGGTSFLNTYFISLKISKPQTWEGEWRILEVVEAQIATPNVDVLIGMDLLLKLDFIWNGPDLRLVIYHE